MVTNQNVLLARYRYDPLDRLTIQASTNKADSHRFYCQGRLSTEVSGAQRCSIVQYADHLLAQRNQGSGVSESTLMATQIHRSVLGVVKKDKCIAFSYSPYGYRVDNSFNSLLGFNGQRPDPVIGHYLLGNGYRAFNPTLMRFNSPDSLSPFAEGGFNCYAYCKGDPVNFIDPSGHSFLFKHLDFLGERATGLFAARKIHDFRRISNSVVVFKDVNKRGTRLTVLGHGAPGMIDDGTGKGLDAPMLNKFLEKNGFVAKEYDTVCIASCHSASVPQGSQSTSLAESFSQITGRPVKGYEGRVGNGFDVSGFDRNGTPEFVWYGIGKGAAATTRAAMKLQGRTYRPRVFFPEAEDVSRQIRKVRS